MIILLNDKQEIVSFANVGSLDGGIEVDDELFPIGFDDLFIPRLYSWKNNKLKLNYPSPPTIDEDIVSNPIDTLQEQNALLLLNDTKQSQVIYALQQQNSLLMFMLAKIEGDKNVETVDI
ncbi:DUF2977 domain-containing protein [Niallia alba]|uniref:DUF2977 domain-containing protein n=1 Tax=Niallia alba TaxID=2729105 RepID=UPI002E24CAD1|nr:DUF2977 domain-containing protein [Niallia alba]